MLPILAVAVAARFYALGRIPYGVWYDEAANGVEGLQAALSGKFPVFYPQNFGREGLFISAIGWLERWFGATPFVLRIPAALAGVATVVMIYLLAARLYSRRTALFAAWFAATGLWPVLLSRIAFRAVLAPLALTSAVYFVVASKDGKRPWMTIVAGVACGIGFHTYPTYRTGILLLVAIFIVELVSSSEKGAVLRRWAVIVATALVTALPLLVYFARHPGTFLSRQSVLVFNLEHPVLRVIYGVGVAARMFVNNSDGNWRQNLSGAPELGWLLAAFFITGAATTFWRFRARKAGWYWLPWAWLVLGLIPCYITFDIPHAIRAGIVMPAAVLLCAIGADAIADVLSLRARSVAPYAVVIVALMAGVGELARYFVEYAPMVVETEAFARRDAAIARAMNEQPDSVRRIVIVPDAYYEYAIKFGTIGHPQPEFVQQADLNRNPAVLKLVKGTLIASVVPDASIFQHLQKRGMRMRVYSAGEVAIAVSE